MPGSGAISRSNTGNTQVQFTTWIFTPTAQAAATVDFSPEAIWRRECQQTGVVRWKCYNGWPTCGSYDGLGVQGGSAKRLIERT